MNLRSESILIVLRFLLTRRWLQLAGWLASAISADFSYNLARGDESIGVGVDANNKKHNPDVVFSFRQRRRS